MSENWIDRCCDDQGTDRCDCMKIFSGVSGQALWNKVGDFENGPLKDFLFSLLDKMQRLEYRSDQHADILKRLDIKIGGEDDSSRI